MFQDKVSLCSSVCPGTHSVGLLVAFNVKPGLLCFFSSTIKCLRFCFCFFFLTLPETKLRLGGKIKPIHLGPLKII